VEWGIPLTGAVVAASSTPARLMGLNERGTIAEGYRADLLVAAEDLTVVQAYRAGVPINTERTVRADYLV